MVSLGIASCSCICIRAVCETASVGDANRVSPVGGARSRKRQPGRMFLAGSLRALLLQPLDGLAVSGSRLRHLAFRSALGSALQEGLGFLRPQLVLFGVVLGIRGVQNEIDRVEYRFAYSGGLLRVRGTALPGTQIDSEPVSLRQATANTNDAPAGGPPNAKSNPGAPF